MAPFLRTKASSALFVSCTTGIVIFCSLAGTLQLTRTLVQRERLQWQHRTNAEAIHIAEQLRTGLPDRLAALRSIGAWWHLQGRPLDPTDWETDMRLFFESSTGLGQVTWIDASGRKSWSAEPNHLPEPHRLDSVPL